MELPEIIGSTILLFSTAVILLFTFSYVIYKLKNQTRLQTDFGKVQEIHTKPEQLKDEKLGRDQLNEPVFSNVDERVQFSRPEITNRFEIVNDSLKLNKKVQKERIIS